MCSSESNYFYIITYEISNHAANTPAPPGGVTLAELGDLLAVLRAWFLFALDPPSCVWSFFRVRQDHRKNFKMVSHPTIIRINPSSIQPLLCVNLHRWWYFSQMCELRPQTFRNLRGLSYSMHLLSRYPPPLSIWCVCGSCKPHLIILVSFNQS